MPKKKAPKKKSLALSPKPSLERVFSAKSMKTGWVLDRPVPVIDAYISKADERKTDGKELEELVKRIEKSLAPQGITVKRVKYQNDAEFDIVVKGKVGSSSIYWLIECRDRPSGGPVGVDWIQQLGGRKNQFKFDKVFAVSTTGFASTAVRAARKLGVILRTVERISEIADDLDAPPIFTLACSITPWPKTTGLFTIPDAPEGPGRVSLKAKYRIKGKGDFEPMYKLYHKAISHNEELATVNETSQYRASICISEAVEIKDEDRTYIVTKMEFEAKIQFRKYRSHIIKADR